MHHGKGGGEGERIVSVPVRGRGCIFVLVKHFLLQEKVSVPVRGRGCILLFHLYLFIKFSFRPREG